MNFSKPMSPVGKNQMRCFGCRSAFSMKDGDWQNHQNQQVFLCKTCQREQREARLAADPLSSANRKG